MAHTEALDLGYIGWSWSGNTDPILDMVLNFDINNLTAWGERIFNRPNGIVETARTATIYGDPEPDPTETPTPDPTETPDPSTDGCSAPTRWSASRLQRRPRGRRHHQVRLHRQLERHQPRAHRHLHRGLTTTRLRQPSAVRCEGAGEVIEAR